jgi:hypothetical protein
VERSLERHLCHGTVGLPRDGVLRIPVYGGDVMSFELHL